MEKMYLQITTVLQFSNHMQVPQTDRRSKYKFVLCDFRLLSTSLPLDVSFDK